MTGTVTWTDRTSLLNRENPACVYRMKNAAGVIIYVGQTAQHLAERIRTHRTRGVGGSPWFDEVTSIEAAEVPRNERRYLERAEIHRWHPIHNKVCVLCTQEALDLLREQGFRGQLLRRPASKYL